MILNEVEAGIVAYVFGRNKDFDREEILIDTNYMTGKREALRSLIPNEMIDGEVMSLVACMLSFQQQETRCWFLPPVFAQFVLSWTRSPDRVREILKDTFFGKVDGLRKIFVPINDGKLHWFLLVVDIIRKELTLLDSLKSPSTFNERKRIVRLLAIFMDQMLEDKSFYHQHSVTEKPKVSEFAIVEPKSIGQQAPGSF
ncbi:unnamed protein product [Cuscuta campestris]|uniref:Ubiquitin-like protease family profile domain-containing protein n=1 Tax=Cuscuta campestris TaxID=132261 RepID=A0A484MQG8_9ASTE|nr:unnamed protein product [Cuscuta campestris]